jgi:hypothetical protein
MAEEPYVIIHYGKFYQQWVIYWYTYFVKDGGRYASGGSNATRTECLRDKDWFEHASDFVKPTFHDA